MKNGNNDFRLTIVFASFIVLVIGFFALWHSFPLILDSLGGFNILSLSATLVLISFPLLIYACIFHYGQGKPVKRWKALIVQIYASLAIYVALGFCYDTLLSSSVPVHWRLIILPLLTIGIAFYLLRRIPRIRKKLDEMS